MPLRNVIHEAVESRHEEFPLPEAFEYDQGESREHYLQRHGMWNTYLKVPACIRQLQVFVCRKYEWTKNNKGTELQQNKHLMFICIPDAERSHHIHGTTFTGAVRIYRSGFEIRSLEGFRDTRM